MNTGISVKLPKINWKLYERFVARLLANQTSTDLCVTPNARVKGLLSDRVRQLDVLIDARHDTDNSGRIIVDAKMRNRRIDVTHVEAFKGLMDDVGAVHGILVCPHGYTKTAKKRAQENVSIRLVPLEALEHFDPSQGEKCLTDKCKGGYIFWDGFPELSLAVVPLDRIEPGPPEHMRFVHFVGKCDFCGRFHIKCCTCEEVFSMTDEDEHKCQCSTPWFWLSSIETDEHGRPSAELHAVTFAGEVMTTSRRPM